MGFRKFLKRTWKKAKTGRSSEYRKAMQDYSRQFREAKGLREKLDVLRRRRRWKKSFWNGEMRLGWNIYDVETRGEFNRKFHFLHFVLKYRIVVPLLKILRRWIDKRLGEFHIPHRPYNKNIEIFNNAYEEAKRLWTEKWHCGGDTSIVKTKGKALDNNKHLMDTVFQGYMRLVMHDSAYREFHNILMHCVAQGMLEEYKGRSVGHVFYNAKHAYDLNWYIMTQYLDKADVVVNTPHGKVCAKRV